MRSTAAALLGMPKERFRARSATTAARPGAARERRTQPCGNNIAIAVAGMLRWGVATVLLSTTAPFGGLWALIRLLERNGGMRVMSRAGRWREYATARVVGPAANPNLPVRARRRLLKRNKLGVANDPALPGHGDLVS